MALSQPVNGYAFVLDGVLIGAGDSRWLAGAQVGLLVAYLPMIAWLNAHTSSLSADQTQAITALWCAMAAFMILRAVVLGLRARSDGWAVTGARAGGRDALHHAGKTAGHGRVSLPLCPSRCR